MKYNLYGLVLLLFLCVSCSSTRNSIAKTQEDIALLSAIKKLDKTPSDAGLKNNLSTLYESATQVHLDNIEVYKNTRPYNIYQA